MTTEKGKSKKKVPKRLKLQEIKKPLIGGGIVAAVAIAGIISGIIIFEQLEEQEPDVFIYGTGGGLHVLDPLLFVTFENFVILENIAEPLFEFEFTSEDSRVIPNLALEGNWSEDALNFSCHLRQGVEFHDGTPFNATAVKWNFDRLYKLRDDPYIYFNLWLHSDGMPIINDTIVIGEYIIRFVLNKPFVPLKTLLGRGPLMVSPSSTPADNFIDFDTGNLIATGPFIHNSTERIYDPVYEEYYSGDSILLPNRDYWGVRPSFDKIIIKHFDNLTLKKEAMISGEIHFTDSYPFDPAVYNNTPGITLFENVESEIDFITMANSVINATMRKAISYALDYTHLVPLGKEFSPGCVKTIRCRSPLSREMLYSNWEDFNVPEYNITKARQTLIDELGPFNSLVAGLTANDNISAGNEWEMLAKTNPIVEYNFSYIIGSDWRTDIAFLFHNNLTQIGINVEPIDRTWPQYWVTTNHFIPFGWKSDYIDPNSHISRLFSNISHDNIAGVNDAHLQQLMEEAVEETNEVVREQQYYDIQKYIIEDLYPVIWWYGPIFANPISLKLRGYNQYNSIKIPWKDWYFV